MPSNYIVGLERLAESLGYSVERIREFLNLGAIHGTAVVRETGRKDRYRVDTAQRQVQFFQETGEISPTGLNPAGLRLRVARARAREAARKARIAKCGCELRIVTRPTRMLFGHPIRDVDPETRALINAALEQRRAQA